MPRLTLIVGLPGSGKSHYAKSKLGGIRYFNDIFHPNYKDDDERNPNAVVNWLLKGNDCVAEDVSLCVPEKREAFLADMRAKVPGVEIQEVYFDRNVENCLLNMLGDFLSKGKHPNYYARIDAFRHLVDRYEIPNGIPRQPVVTPYALKKVPPL